jgi:MiaB/RimO family radical SAM methylthiotransferase
MKIHVCTNGCIEGQISSSNLHRWFKNNGAVMVDDPAEADFVAFWACGLTKKREIDSLSLIGKIQGKMKPDSRLIVWGCLPKINSQELSKIYSGPILGPRDIGCFEGVLDTPLKNLEALDKGCSERFLISKQSSVALQKNNAQFLDSPFVVINHRWDSLCAKVKKTEPFWIRISSGCTGHCTYCSEHCAFGRVRSRPMENILADLRIGLSQGYRLFSLLGTDVGAYGKDVGLTIADLLEEIVKVDEDKSYKLVLNQVNPFYLKEMFDRLEKIFESGKIKSFDSPVQSGSDRLLKVMGRPYDAEDWREYMIRINTRFPSIRLSTHFMVGFPSESDEDFRATLRLLDYPLFLDSITVFRFSAVNKVLASRFPGQISERIKELRSRALLCKHSRMLLMNSQVRLARKIRRRIL